MIKKILQVVGVYILYVAIILAFYFGQSNYSDPGFILSEFKGNHIQNFIITLVFILFCMLTGIILRIMNRKSITFSIIGFWVFVLLSYVIVNNWNGESPAIFLITLFTTYPIMCGISYIGITDSYEGLSIITYIFLCIIVPCISIGIGYVLANVYFSTKIAKEQQKNVIF